MQWQPNGDKMTEEQSKKIIVMLLDAYIAGYVDGSQKRESRAWEYITEMMRKEHYEKDQS